MEAKELTNEERLEYAKFFLNICKLLQGGEDISKEEVKGMRDKIAQLLKSNAFTNGEKDELADMCIMLHQSLGGE